MVGVQEGAQPPTSEPGRRYSCSLCQKTFEHEVSAKRHFYYCRSRPIDTQGSRKRSCVACVCAKARCIWPAEIGLSSCLRCDRRGAVCEYGRRRALDRVDEDIIPTTPVQVGRSADVPESSTALISTRSPHDDTSDQTRLDIGAVTELTFIDSLNVNFDDLEFDITPAPLRGTNSMSLACSKIAKLPSIRVNPPAPWGYLQPQTPLFTTRAFTRPDHVACVSLAMRVLRSYPSMMLVKGALPPFIHSSAYPRARVDEEYNTYRSLANCSNLVRLFKTQNVASKKSWAWGQIWYEQERILTEYLKFDQWELLDSLQTLLIFCLLRLQDTPVGHAVFDVSLLTTVNLISQALDSSINGCLDCSLPEDPAAAWRDWIFLESRRRTVLIFQIVGLLVDVSTTVSYSSIGGLVLVPLPGSVTMWDTNDFERWKLEYRKWHGRHIIYGVSETGGLTKLQSTDDGIKSSSAEWEDWSAEVGDVATLVMIIGELLKNQ
ncbi:hypothetical protein GGR58DRAFT_468135 [Xylaria digitata]|nr:hypothetical protein GGR58DRAFT_468135 [Xylaria digitata]